MEAAGRVGGRPPKLGVVGPLGEAMEGGSPLSGLVGAQPEKLST